MSQDPSTMGRDAARAEVQRLTGVLHVVHDHLHQGHVDDAHQALHCSLTGESPSAGNITLDQAARIQRFCAAFNHLCRDHEVPAATVIMVPSATVEGAVSLQLGGHVQTIQILREMMGKAPTHAIGGR